MKLVNIASQSFEDVPEADAPAKLAAGSHAFENAEQRIPIRTADGQLGTVAAKDYQGAIDAGATLASEQEVHHADVEARHAGIGGTVAAGAEGLVRGATVGLSDPIAINIAKLFGKGEDVRTHLAEEQEAHPVVSTVGELGGAALPTLLSGGAGAAAEGASIGGRLAQIARTVAAPVRGVGALGDLAGEATARVLETPTARSAVARILGSAAKTGVQGAAEGALFGAGSQISEDSLGDHELNAEKLVAAMGHGALYGAMVGGGLGAVRQMGGETYGALVRRAGPYMERQANVQAVKAYSPTTQVMREAEARAGGVQALGETARRYDVVPSSVVEAAKVGPEQLLERTKVARETVGDAIGEIVSGSTATVKASEVLDPLDRRIASLNKTAASRDAARSLQTFRDDLADSLGVRAPAVPKMPQTAAELQGLLRTNPKAAAELATTGRLTGKFLEGEATAADVNVPVQQLIKERRALQQRIFQEVKSLQPRLPVQELREFSGELNELEQRAIDSAGHELGADQGTRLRSLNKDYQRLSILEQAAETRVAKHSALRAISPTSYLTGMAVGAGSLAAGHVTGALKGIGTALGHQLVLERGNIMAASALAKIGKLDLIVRANQAVDRELGGAIGDFVTRGSSRAAARAGVARQATDIVSDLTERALSSEGANAQANLTPDHVDKALPTLPVNAPKTSLEVAGLVSRQARYLASIQPPQSMETLLTKGRGPSMQDASRYVRMRGAVDDPVGTISRALRTGQVHADEIEAIRQTKPKLFAAIQRALIAAVATHRDAMTYDKVRTLSTILGSPMDPSQDTPAMQSYAAAYAAGPPASPSPQQPPAKGAPKRMLKGPAEAHGLSMGEVNATP